ncbi:hypothetical protein LUZ63_009351 [Rhynchospora breviuscula]|uniref:Uncharacterized protein n=1 Tax=Rhynchospora breviuscula TaxID=2022672 RepID=A0A9Q0HNX8_9POAL|nr:hypothetical protein LUZ63_009351 [Rhynchospora breviuscula]
MRRSTSSWILLILVPFLLRRVVFAKIHGNPANEIMTVINNNRTSIKLPKLHDNAGLGCMALQYITECTSNCTSNGTLACKPPEIDITEVYAANCGVELPTVDSVTNHLITCSWNYLSPEEAFSKILGSDKKAGSIIHDKGNVEAGAGFNKAGRHGPYFWCLLFSSGKGNSTFVLEGGKGIEQKTGCFSGGGLTCNSGFRVLELKHLFLMAMVFSGTFVLL